MAKKEKTLRVCSVVAITLSLLYSPAAALEPMTVTLDMFSGRPNPEIVLTDSESVSLLNNRIGRYMIISMPGDSTAPLPLNILGYRGVICTYMLGTEKIKVGASNGCYYENTGAWPPTFRFHDYDQEMEKMALRFCRRTLASSPLSENALAIKSIPDSLTGDYGKSGFVTIEYSGPAYLDISLLKNKYQKIQQYQNPSIATDFQFSLGSGVPFILRSFFGIKDMGVVAGFSDVQGTDLTANIDQLLATYRQRFDSLHLTAPDKGYTEVISVTGMFKPGQMFIVKTSEGGYAAVIYAGTYIGGVNRYHFYYSFSTNTKFGPEINQTTSTAFRPRQGTMKVGDPWASLQKSLVVNARGQRIARPNPNQQVPSQRGFQNPTNRK
jgi:hypothetical protein